MGKLTFNNFGNIEIFSQDNSDHTSDMDDFTTSNTAIKTHSYIDTNDCESDDEFIKTNNIARPLVLDILPEVYSYKMLTVSHFEDLESFTCNFKIKLENEERWIVEYNVKAKERMLFDYCKKLSGKRVLKKLYLRCQHKQRQTGKHKKSNKALKTTHKGHNNKNTDCSAQIVVTILPSKKHRKFCVEVTLKHMHNHLVDVADALWFRPVSDNTKEKYYDLFRQSHSPSSAHLEYKTHT